VDSIERGKKLAIFENLEGIPLDELKRIPLDVSNVNTNHLESSQMVAIPSTTRLTE
jgi:hypothetical protein